MKSRKQDNINMKNIFAVAVFPLIISANAFAGGLWTAAGTVSSYYPNSTQSAIYVKSSAAITNPSSCSKTTYYRMDLSNSASKEISALLLTAQVSGKSVLLYIDDTQCSSDSYPLILHALLK